MTQNLQSPAQGRLSAEEALKLLAERRGIDPDAARPPAPAPEESRNAATPFDPVDHIAAELKELVLAVLKLPESEFSMTTPLLEYGLDSIAATELGTRFTERFKITVPPTVFFEFPDVQGFSRYLAENHAAELKGRYDHLRPAAAAEPQPPQTPPTRPVQQPEPAAPSTAAKPAPFPQSAPGAASEPPADSPQHASDGLVAIEQLWAEGARNLAMASPQPGQASVKQPSSAELKMMLATAEQADTISIKRKGRHTLECATFGDGPPVLMLGGLLMHYAAMWRPQLAPLGAHHRLIMFHMPGCGGVELYDGLSLDSIVQDIDDLLDALGIDTPLPVVGCSFGGVLAQAFCLAHPERCASLALTVTTPISEGATDFQKLMRELQSSSSFMEVNRGWPMGSLASYSHVIEGFDLRDRLHEISVPCLIVSGGKDEYTPAGFSEIIAENVPDAELMKVDDAGHLLPFTHYETFNDTLLDFLSRHAETNGHAEKEAVPERTAHAPVGRKTLEACDAYIREGRQGHCVLLPETAAKTAYLLNRLCRTGKAEPETYRSYFVPSIEEALDAALRLSRHHARNKRPQSSGTILLLERGHRWSDYFNPLGASTHEALLPGVTSVASASQLRARIESESDVTAVVLTADSGLAPSEMDALLRELKDAGILSVVVETEEKDTAPADFLAGKLRAQPDLVVFGETIAGFQAPVAACCLKTSLSNPWLMTPNEGYARQPMAANGLPVTLALEHLSAALAGDSEIAKETDAIGADRQSVYAAHLKYGNVGYARVARMHGYDGDFHDAYGMRSKLTLHDGQEREIVDCLLNVGTAPRGLNSQDVLDKVLKAHDPEKDYWAELGAFLEEKTGYDTLLPASSQTAAIEAGVALGLMAAGKRKKMLCFSGGAGFSMLSAATAHDPLFDLWRRPFQALYPHTVFVDPAAEDAAETLRKELRSGEVGLVWMETHQVEGNAIRPLPENLIHIVGELRDEGGYLLAVDETQTNLWTGKFLHSEDLIPNPDIVAIATAICDSFFPAGAVLTRRSLFEKAETANPRRAKALRERSAFPLTAHLALNALRDLYGGGKIDQAQEKGAYLKAKLQKLSETYPLLKEVRGEGLLLAIEFDLTGYSEFVQRSFGYLLWGAMLRDPEGGVAVVVCPIHNNAMRIVPALDVTREEIDLIVANLRRRLAAGVSGIVRDCAAYNRSLGEERTAEFLLGQIGPETRRTTDMEATETKAVTRSGIAPLKGSNGMPSICIIGAGVGGISMAGALKKKGIPFDCFDKRERIGGIWAFDEKRRNTSVWHGLNMNTPRGWYQYSDFPMPEDYPDFPQWHQVQSYLERYIDHLDMRDHFHLGQEVAEAKRLESGRWRVVLGSGETRYYDAVIVANGHHNTPNYPAYADKFDFDGPAIHSQHYRYRHDYRDKNVMIVGIGNSGAQIAVDVSFDAKMTYISLRRGVYLLPHYMFGLRVDKFLGPSLSWWFKKILPGKLYPAFFTGVYHLLGNHRGIGMPKPDHLMMTCLPTVTESLANRIGDGKIKLVPEVKSIEGNTVELADGNTIEVDAIIYSTGYHTTLPFFEKDFFEVRENKIPLFKRLFKPDTPNLAFVGMFQAIRWGFLDVMENQSKLIADYFAGEYALPSEAEMETDIDKERKGVEREFMHTLRNNYYLHGDTYIRELRKELKRGKRRIKQGAKTGNFPVGSDVTSVMEAAEPRLVTAAE
ncbi:MAG: aminotransferase class III-fold pyridoxal phosphate-dependent enzyme [Methyloligella sp. ZOD6]